MRVVTILGAVALSAALARAQGAPGAKAAAAPALAARSGAVDLEAPTQVKALCLATRPPERVVFDGDEVARGAAREKFVADRESALGGLYLARIPPTGFRLGEYRTKEGELPLDLSRSLRALHGALTLSVPSDAAIAFLLSPDDAQRVVAAVRAGTATLHAYFELADEVGAVCSGNAAANVFTVSANPVAFELRDADGRVVARHETALADRHRAALGGYSGTPAAVVGAVSTDEPGADASGIARRLQAGIKDPVRRCYAKRLEQDPAAGGSVVVGVETGSDGRVSSVQFIVSALGDEGLQKCIDDAIREVRFTGAQLFKAPIELKLLPR